MAAPWTPERDARLTKLWTARQLSCVAIAERLGGGATKGSVIGRVHRLGLAGKGGSVPGKQTSEQAIEAMRAARAARPKYVRPVGPDALAALYEPAKPVPVPAAETPLVIPPIGVKFADRGDRQCGWISGPYLGPDTLCCGAPRAFPAPYCPKHRDMARGAVPRPRGAVRDADAHAIPRTTTRSLKSGSYI